MIALLCAAAQAEPVPTDPVHGALLDQLAYQDSLRLADAPEIYHLRYHLLELDQVDIRASLGSVVEVDESPYNLLAVEVRVGSTALDNSGFGGWQDGFLRAPLPGVLTPDAISAEAWRLTDNAYKQAIEQYARKRSQLSPTDDAPGDYTLVEKPTVADEGVAVPEDAGDRLAALAVRLTAVLEGPTTLERGEVYVGYEAGSLTTVDSEGADVRTPVAETTVRALAAIRAPDGMLLTDHRLWTVRNPSDLPEDDVLLAAVTEMRDDLVRVAAAPVLDDEYVGPVIFEDAAAIDLFRFVLSRQLEGTPPEIPFDSTFGDIGDDRDPVRVGRRVLPLGWTVTDDPTELPRHPGSYRYDNEGTPSRRVELVEDGIVRTVAMSRVPRRGIPETNGHARGLVGQRAVGRVSMLTVEPERHRSAARVGRAARRLARGYGRDWVLVIRRLQEPTVLALDTELFMDETIALPPPLVVVRRWPDGREELVRGASFAGIERWILRDIAAAGPEREGDWFAPLQGTNWAGSSPTGGVPCHTRAPDVLIGEIEMVPSPGDPRALPVLPPPIAVR